MRQALLAVVVVTGMLSWTASAASFTVDFPSVDSTVIANGGDLGGHFGYFWSVARGDSIEETFTGTGLASVNGLDLSFGVVTNVLNSGAYTDWDVSVNGIVVGGWSWSESDGLGTVNQSYMFPSIFGGGTYAIRMAMTNEVAGGQGSISIGYPGSATLYDDAGEIPEPSTMWLAGMGFLGILGLRRSRCLLRGRRTK